MPPNLLYSSQNIGYDFDTQSAPRIVTGPLAIVAAIAADIAILWSPTASIVQLRYAPADTVSVVSVDVAGTPSCCSISQTDATRSDSFKRKRAISVNFAPLFAHSAGKARCVDQDRVDAHVHPGDVRGND